MKGVFCLEDFWYGDHRDKTSLKPVLDLLHCYQDLPFLHHRCATKEEFVFSLQRWKTKAFHDKYPVLWIGCHGAPGKIFIGKEELTIQELGDILQDKCQRAVIYFGSCATMKWDGRYLQNFMQQTKTVAVLGYKEEVEWLPSASFEIRLLSYFQDAAFTSDGIKKVKSKINEECGALSRDLKFRFEVNERIRFTAKKTKQISK